MYFYLRFSIIHLHSFSYFTYFILLFSMVLCGHLHQAMIQSASSLLFNATGSKLFLKDVVIVVPELWPCDGEYFDSLQRAYSWDSAHLRVSPAHHLFGDNPWTQQPGVCGHPGDWIYLPENFVLSNTSSYGSPGECTVYGCYERGDA